MGPEGTAAGMPPATAPSLKIQLFSDLHLETETFDPEPAPGADVLVLAGDIDATWRGYSRFADWPVPVLAVAGNHEFDGREWLSAWPALRAMGEDIGLRWLEHGSWTQRTDSGLTVRWLGATRWSDFDVFGPEGRPRAQRAGAYFQKLSEGSLGGDAFDTHAVRQLGLSARQWLADTLFTPPPGDAAAPDLTVVVTHFAPSLRCGDPRYGQQPGTASFCNADDDLLPGADLWLHGHVHCRHDFIVAHGAAALRRTTRVVSQARGHGKRREQEGYDPGRLVEVRPASTAASGLGG